MAGDHGCRRHRGRDRTGAAAMKGIAEEGPGYAIEDFGYPNADKILAEQNIALKRGDGHILLADCASGTDLLEVLVPRARTRSASR